MWTSRSVSPVVLCYWTNHFTNMVVWLCGTVMEIAGVVEKVLQEVLDGKVTEAGLLVPENLGEYVIPFTIWLSYD